MSNLCLLHHYILEADNLSSSFSDSQMERKCPRMDHTQSLTAFIPDLDDLNNKI